MFVLMTTKCTFTVGSWKDTPYSEGEGLPTLTRSSVTYKYEGEIEGESTSESLMIGHADGSASYITLERITGRIGGRLGSFVLEGKGIYDKENGARSSSAIVPGSGTGELAGIKGTCRVNANQPPWEFELDYEFE
jgi:Protein of unknown function (DUF3224)